MTIGHRLLIGVGLAAVVTQAAFAADVPPGRRYMPPPRKPRPDSAILRGRSLTTTTALGPMGEARVWTRSPSNGPEEGPGRPRVLTLTTLEVRPSRRLFIRQCTTER